MHDMRTNSIACNRDNTIHLSLYNVQGTLVKIAQQGYDCVKYVGAAARGGGQVAVRPCRQAIPSIETD